MGRSAKVHKRLKKATSSTSHASKPGPSAPPPPTASSLKLQNTTANATPSVKRRTTLKQKAAASAVRKQTGGNAVTDVDSNGHVLGGADYVELLMGSRRRAREEAGKLAQT